MDITDQSSSIISNNSSPSDCSDQDNEVLPLKKRTQAEKKMDRILANRRSARRSRERRKKLQHNLEISVAFLTRQNEELARENTNLKGELTVLINLVNQMIGKRGLNAPAATTTSSDIATTMAILNQVGSQGTVIDRLRMATPTPSNGANQATALLSTSGEGINNMSPEQILALSQYLSNPNQPQFRVG